MKLMPRVYTAIADWAHAIVAFLRSPHIAGQRLVAIGHSAGATALCVILLLTRDVR